MGQVAATATLSAKINAFQRKLISIVFGIRPEPCETAKDFIERRHIVSGQIARKHGPVVQKLVE